MDATKLTKAELVRALAERNAECEALRLQVATLQGDVAARDARIAKAEAWFREHSKPAALPPAAEYCNHSGQWFRKVRAPNGVITHRRITGPGGDFVPRATEQEAA